MARPRKVPGAAEKVMDLLGGDGWGKNGETYSHYHLVRVNGPTWVETCTVRKADGRVSEMKVVCMPAKEEPK